MLMAAGALVFSACREDAGTTRETNENDSSTPDNAAGPSDNTTSSLKEYNFDEEYRDRANRMVSQVSQDLDLDTSAQARLRTVYYNRARQIDELETRFSSTNRSGGFAADSGDMTIGADASMDANMNATGATASYPDNYYNELESINSTVDTEVRGFLTSDQFKLYQANRQKYYEADMKFKAENGGKLKIDGEEAKLKTDDVKIKREGDEYKYKSDDVKIKREGDESKLKTDDLKIKKEGDEMKIKTDNSKIKVEN